MTYWFFHFLFFQTTTLFVVVSLLKKSVNCDLQLWTRFLNGSTVLFYFCVYNSSWDTSVCSRILTQVHTPVGYILVYLKFHVQVASSNLFTIKTELLHVVFFINFNQCYHDYKNAFNIKRLVIKNGWFRIRIPRNSGFSRVTIFVFVRVI